MSQRLDDKLLILYKYLQEHPFSRDTVAETLSITTRQLSRLMKQWEKEGFLEYRVGVGRGILSEVSFKEDIEQRFVTELIHQLEDYSYEEMEEILKLPMHKSSEALIRALYNQKLLIDEGCVESSNEGSSYIDYIYRIPDNYDPLEGNDVSKDVLHYNVMDRLYDVDNQLNFSSELISHEEMDEDSITIYLHHDIKFSDGTVLFAVNVVRCLERLFAHPDHQHKFEGVTGLEVVNLFCFKMYFKTNIDHIKLALSYASASIYDYDEQENIIGTGMYKVKSSTDSYIELCARNDSHYPTPDITTIYLVNSYKQYMSSFKHEDTKIISRGKVRQKGFLCYNPKFTPLNKEERAHLSELIYQFFQKYNNNEQMKFKDIEVFDTPFTIGMFSDQNSGQIRLYEILKEAGFNVHAKCIDFSDILAGNSQGLQCDLFFLAHTYLDEVFYYSLLTNTNLRCWFMEFEQSKAMVEQFNSSDKAHWKCIESEYKSFIEGNYWVHPLIHSFRDYIIPKHFKNVQLNNDGIIIYRKIIQ